MKEGDKYLQRAYNCTSQFAENLGRKEHMSLFNYFHLGKSGRVSHSVF